MFDYKLLAALGAVVEQGGFDRAAQVLGLSQSAVSQRIKLLETRVGQPVLIRANPPEPTEMGRRLLNHVQQVRLLESDLGDLIPDLDECSSTQRLRVALNADSLATWWAPAIGAFSAQQPLLLDLLVEDQDVGLKRMRAGEVAACLCAVERPVAGARSLALGSMRYRALASADFLERHFPDGVSLRALTGVPAIVFGPDDRLQHRYLSALGIEGGFVHHLCPSSEGFVRLIEAGIGWGLVPELQVRESLASGALCEVVADTPVDVPLYWHHWRNGGELLNRLTEHLVRTVPTWLVKAERNLARRG